MEHPTEFSFLNTDQPNTTPLESKEKDVDGEIFSVGLSSESYIGQLSVGDLKELFEEIRMS